MHIVLSFRNRKTLYKFLLSGRKVVGMIDDEFT